MVAGKASVSAFRMYVCCCCALMLRGSFRSEMDGVGLLSRPREYRTLGPAIALTLF